MYNDIKTGLSVGALTAPTAVTSVKVYEVAPGAPAREMLACYMEPIPRLGAKPMRDWDKE